MEWTSLSLKEKLQLSGACLFLVTMPYSREINQVCMVLFLLTCAIGWNKEIWVQNRKTILIFISIYLVAIFSGLYDPNKLEAYKKLELQSTLLLVPLLLGASYRPTAFKTDVIKIAFITGVCSALAYLIVHFVFHMRAQHLPVSAWLRKEYLNHHYSDPIGIHAGFFSVYVSLCLLALTLYLMKARRFLLKTVLTLLIILCLVSLFLLTSRSVLIMTFLCLAGMTPAVFKRLKWYFGVPAGIAICAILYFFVTKSVYFEQRFTGELNQDIKLKELTRAVEDHQSPEKQDILKNDGARIERWVASWQLIKARPLLGYGTGEEKPELFRKYKEMGLTVSLDEHYDSHNQFLSFTIKSGALGLIAFVGMLIYSWVQAIKRKSFLYISFLLLVTGTCLIDTMLEVNKGIFFFAFFNIFFYLSVTPRPGSRGTGAHQPAMLKALP